MQQGSFKIFSHSFLPHMRILSTLITFFFITSIYSQTNYCKPGAFTGDDGACSHSWIRSVSIANITNQNDVCDGDDPFNLQGADGYSDYSELLVRMQPGGQYTLTVVIDGFIFNDCFPFFTYKWAKYKFICYIIK